MATFQSATAQFPLITKWEYFPRSILLLVVSLELELAEAKAAQRVEQQLPRSTPSVPHLASSGVPGPVSQGGENLFSVQIANGQKSKVFSRSTTC